MVLEQWLESPYYQYFCGETFFNMTSRAIQPVLLNGENG